MPLAVVATPARPAQLTPDQMEKFGAEMDAIRRRVLADLGESDAAYIRKILKRQQQFELAGRVLFYLPPAWPLAVASLAVSKILDNMELGHNVLHGQYDWMGDPAFHSRIYDFDTVCVGKQWQYTHNYKHHAFTNILGKDRDIGFGILRMDAAQKWHPYYLGNPLWALALMVWFEWALAFHNLEVEDLVTGRRSHAENKALYPEMFRKIAEQKLKDYVLFPALTGPLFVPTFLGNLAANFIRNVWEFANDMCAHFADGVEVFTEDECNDLGDDQAPEESRGHWYYRQLLGSANITGTRPYHVMCGHVSYQIEHHLFPDIPACRYPQIAVEVEDICRRYGLEYNTGRLSKQLWGFWKKTFKHALPTRPATEDPAVRRKQHLQRRIKGYLPAAA